MPRSDRDLLDKGRLAETATILGNYASADGRWVNEHCPGADPCRECDYRRPGAFRFGSYPGACSNPARPRLLEWLKAGGAVNA